MEEGCNISTVSAIEEVVWPKTLTPRPANPWSCRTFTLKPFIQHRSAFNHVCKTATAVGKQQPKDVSKADNSAVIEDEEQSAKASASAGLNLNVFGALAGAFSGKNSKKAEEDGSTLEEHEQDASVSAGAGAGNLNARGAANAEQSGRQMRAAIQEKSAAP